MNRDIVIQQINDLHEECVKINDIMFAELQEYNSHVSDIYDQFPGGLNCNDHDKLLVKNMLEQDKKDYNKTKRQHKNKIYRKRCKMIMLKHKYLI